MTEEFEEKEFSAPTVEQAIDKACDYYNLTQKNLSYEVTKSSSRGILRSKKTVTIIARPLKVDEKPKVTKSSNEIDESFASAVLNETNNILKMAGLSLSAERTDDGQRFIMNIAGPDRMYLLSKNGEGIEAMQYILNKMFTNDPKYTKILLDSNGFRDQKEHQLVQLAHSTASKVKRQKRSMTLEPLNSYERRIIHMALSNDNEVQTSSRGEGQLKRITISLVR